VRSKAESSRIRQHFWTSFGQYLRPIPGADGQAVNWVNYKTGHRKLFFRMDADRSGAFIGIVMAMKNRTLQALYYEQFQLLESALHSELGEIWNWETDYHFGSGALVHAIYRKAPQLNIYRESDWPDMISFLKPRILALDHFWSMAQHTFHELEGL
jgi:hypothetical protein